MKIITSIKSIALLLILFFASVPLYAANYYWVGGSGNWSDINHWRTTSGGNSLPTVVPGPTDDVYFDANSGFTNTSKTITIDVTANCRNIMFSNNSVAPDLTQNGSQTLNIYGSSEWQTGMEAIKVNTIYYRHNGIPKNIKSNGVITGSGYVYFEEETSIDLLDDLFIGSIFSHLAGTFNTQNHIITIGSSFYAASGLKSRTLNLGSSEILINGNYTSTFTTDSPNVIVNAGTSHIRFTKATTGITSGLTAYPGQAFYNVSFEGDHGVIKSSIHSTSITAPVIFNQLSFNGNGVINGNNSYGTLLFSGAKTYSFEKNTIQTIRNLLSAHTTDCEGWVTIETSEVDEKAQLIAGSTAVINVSGAIIKDIHASGGADFTVNNSVDAGNNAGWVFTPYDGKNLYWVGGGGNWDDKNHWSDTSGGIGGYCVPGPLDNVFFNENSGFTLSSRTIIGRNTVYCHNITFSGSPVSPYFTEINTLTPTLNIYGSSEWQVGMPPINFKNIYYRSSGVPKTIKTNGVKTGAITATVYLEEETIVDLLDDLNITYNLRQKAGTFNTNNHNITIGYGFYVNGIYKPRILNLGSSEIRMNSERSSFNTNSEEVDLNAGTSHIIFTNLNSDIFGINAGSGQVYHDVTFLGKMGAISGTNSYSYTFNRVEFLGNGTIKGNNTFNTLIFTSGNNYKILTNSNQTVTSLFSLRTPLCDGWSSISSSLLGTKATISASATAVIDISGTVMQDIHAVGNADFMAQNSLDNGNNDGWTFANYTGQNLYWVGGSGNWNDKAHWSNTSGGTGGFCVPGVSDNVFFDNGSGFTTTNRNITIDNTAYCRDIIFAGSIIAPKVVQNGNQTLNIYESSEWQEGMDQISVSYIYYRHTGVSKTIKSNGVKTGVSASIDSGVYFEEESSINLLDNFSCGYDFYHNAGVLNTNDFDINTHGFFYSNKGNKPRTLDLGNSNIWVSSFYSSSQYVMVTAGTSHIYIRNGGRLEINNGQVFNNVTFLSNSGVLSNNTINGEGFFNRLEFKGNGTISSNNTFKELIFNEGKTYKLTADKTQNIESWILGGTPCNVTFIESSVLGSRTNINVTGETTHFNFTNIKDLNAIGKTLHFGEQSTVANQNNINITYDPYNPGAFNGLGSDWLCHEIDETNPLTYIITTELFYGNDQTTYKWYKLNDPNHDPLVVIATSDAIDIRDFGGFGTYRVVVSYSDGSSITCEVPSTIDVVGKTPFPTINKLIQTPELPTDDVVVCKKQTNTLADITVNGVDVKWYTSETSSITIDPNTVIENGQIYYVTQTLDDCESNRMPIAIVIKNCFSLRVNPGIRMRVAN